MWRCSSHRPLGSHTARVRRLECHHSPRAAPTPGTARRLRGRRPRRRRGADRRPARRTRQVEMKSARSSIVTEADVTSQAEIFEVIGSAFPEHAILGEEGDGGGPDTTYTWIVDPLDGTSNYASGIPFACVSVGGQGRRRRGRRGDLRTVPAGVVHRHPWRRSVARRAHRRSRVSARTTRSTGRSCATGLQSDDPAQIAAHARRIEALHLYSRAPACSVRRRCAWRTSPPVGSTRSTSATPRTPGTSPPAALMITEAGGRCEDLDGGPLNLGHGVSNVLATNGAIHDGLFDLIQRTDSHSSSVDPRPCSAPRDTDPVELGRGVCSVRRADRSYGAGRITVGAMQHG